MTRDFHPGMGQAVAERTILRPGETWGDVADRVADGNCSLVPSGAADLAGFKAHLHNATILMSGRHLQHGDLDQKNRPYEIYTNCSTSPTSFMLLYLLLSGCFRAGTQVKMGNGTFKKIEEMLPGDYVVSYDEEAAEFVNQEVTALNVNTPKMMVRVHLEDGTYVDCTEDHKFLNTDGIWREAQHLANTEVKQNAHR